MTRRTILSLRIFAALTAVSTAASAQTPAPSFTNVTAAMGIHSIYSPTNFSHALYCGGGAVGDFDNDGVQEIFIMRGAASGVRDRFYKMNGSGVYEDKAAQWGLTAIHNGKGVAVGDFNNDGFLDMYVTSAGAQNFPQAGKHKLYKNNGNGTFTDVAAAAGVDFSSTIVEDGFGAAFGDYDLDGDLDLFVAGFSNSNHGSRLFRNNGNETFTDVTAQIGFFSGSLLQVHAFAPRFVDMDGDRYPEILLSADFGTSRYYRNNTDGTFTDVTSTSGAGQAENGMGQTIGDWNNDGLIDWYNTSIYYPSFGWTGNKLYLNQGSHSLSEASNTFQTFDGGYGWGAVGVDFNHDGWMDIAETNGDDTFSGGDFINEQAYLWMNVDGQSGFNEMATQSGFINNRQGRGLLNFDMDNDGDQDLLVLAWNEEAELYRNNISDLPDARWLRLLFDTSQNPGLAPNGYGTRATITIGGALQMRYLSGGDNFLSYSELSMHFGTGTEAVIDNLTVEWANGQVTTMTNVNSNQTLTIVAPEGAGSAFCFGNGSGTNCPCNNNSSTDSGCANTSGADGATLTSSGNAYFSNDSFKLHVSGIPGAKAGICVKGSSQIGMGNGNAVGDGLLCTAPQIRSQVVVSNSSGNANMNSWRGQAFGSYPNASNIGSPTYYQWWYRDPSNTCSGQGFNFANAWAVDWMP
ncbi:MAG: hypothetical protein ACI8X5_002614 [Planctomycetota bacterium]|jgi:hypothetical protein